MLEYIELLICAKSIDAPAMYVDKSAMSAAATVTLLWYASAPRLVTCVAPFTVSCVARAPRPTMSEASASSSNAKPPRPFTFVWSTGVPDPKITLPAESLIVRLRVSILVASMEPASIRAASINPALILPALRFTIFASSIAASPIFALVIVPSAIKACLM